MITNGITWHANKNNCRANEYECDYPLLTVNRIGDLITWCKENNLDTMDAMVYIALAQETLFAEEYAEKIKTQYPGVHPYSVLQAIVVTSGKGFNLKFGSNWTYHISMNFYNHGKRMYEAIAEIVGE